MVKIILLLIGLCVIPTYGYTQSYPTQPSDGFWQDAIINSLKDKVDVNSGTSTDQILTTPTINGGTVSNTDISNGKIIPENMTSSVSLSSFVGQVSNVINAGAVGAGEDDSTIVQQLLNSGVNNLYFPPGKYKLCGIIIPPTVNLHIFGSGTESQIIQGNCNSPVFSWSQTAMAWDEQTISNLYFDSTNGTSHTIDTRGQGGVTLSQLYFNETPASYDNIYIGGVASTYTHDVRIINNQFYSSTSGPIGNSMIEFGSLSADAVVSGSIGNGSFVTKNAIVVASDATTIAFLGNHLYNTSTNVIVVNGCSNCQFIGNTWDNSKGTVAIIGAKNSVFNGEQIESVNPSQDGIDLVGAQANSFNGTIIGTSGCSSNYAINEDSNSINNIFTGGTINTISCWKTPVVNFYSINSYELGFPGLNKSFIRFGFSGSTSSAITAGTSTYLGINGNQTTINATSYVAPYNGYIQTLNIATSTTPASGGSYSFSLMDGSTTVTTCSISSGSYSCNISLNYNIEQTNQLYIVANISSGSPAPFIRYFVNING